MKSNYFEDVKKVLNSAAYARYDKTQVSNPAFAREGVCRRWLHVQLVSNIARAICRDLGLNESLAEASGLAHDLGHTPYGHEGEACLNTICQENGIGYFYHAAQGARLVTEIEPLGLSTEVVDGILSHNGEQLSKDYQPDPEKTSEKMAEEIRGCFTVAHYESRIRPMSLEGCVIRASDVIAYIGRDLEDGIAAGVISRDDIPREIVAVLGNTEESIRNTLMEDMLRESAGKGTSVGYSDRVFAALKALMDFNYANLYPFRPAGNSPYKNLQELHKQNFRLLFQYCCDRLRSGDDSDIVRWVKARSDHYTATTPLERQAVDYIACMTDEGFEKAVAALKK